MPRREGNSYSKLLGLVRDVGYNKDVELFTAKVTSSPPNLVIEAAVIGFPIEADDVILTESLAQKPLVAGDQVIVLFNGNAFYVIDKAVQGGDL